MSVSESEPKNKLRWTILVCYSSNPNSFLIYTQSPDVDNEIISRGEIQPVHLSLTFRSKPRWWKTVSTVESIDQDVNAEFTHSHCTQKPTLAGQGEIFDQWKRGNIYGSPHIWWMKRLTSPQSILHLKYLRSTNLCKYTFFLQVHEPQLIQLTDSNTLLSEVCVGL